jgi:hypothetical protein
MDKKIKEWKKACIESGKWLSKVENSHQNKVYQQNYNVWKDIGIWTN